MMSWRLFTASLLVGLGLAPAAMTSALTQAAAEPSVQPPVLPVQPDPMARADADMAKVIHTFKKLGRKPIETLEPGEARRQPNLVDAAAKVIKAQKLDVKPHAGLTVTESRFAALGDLHLRFYEPAGTTSASNVPVVVYFRGGGWVLADLDDYDSSAAALARKTGAVVVSVDYPLAPTDKFPAAHDEAVAAYQYLLKQAKGWGYDSSRMALVGEGAGGNLAINTAIAARDLNIVPPVAVVAIYPVATTAMDTPSKREDATAKPLNTAMLTWFFGHLVKNEADRQDPRLNLVAANLKGLPPVTVINAAIDPLRSDGDLLAEKLKETGVETTHQVYEGVTHDFFGQDAVVAKAEEAQDFAAAQLKRAFAEPR